MFWGAQIEKLNDKWEESCAVFDDGAFTTVKATTKAHNFVKASAGTYTLYRAMQAENGLNWRRQTRKERENGKLTR